MISIALLRGKSGSLGSRLIAASEYVEQENTPNINFKTNYIKGTDPSGKITSINCDLSDCVNMCYYFNVNKAFNKIRNIIKN